MGFKIRVSTESFDLSRYGSVLGNISVECNDIWFPTKNWSDFPVIVLSWWTFECLRLLDGEVAMTDFSFMDGPHKIDVRRKGRYGLILVLFDSDTERASLEVDLREVFFELIKAAKITVSFCDRNGWGNDDLKILKSGLERIEVFERCPERWR
jgi:hypothetical protein